MKSPEQLKAWRKQWKPTFAGTWNGEPLIVPAWRVSGVIATKEMEALILKYAPKRPRTFADWLLAK